MTLFLRITVLAGSLAPPHNAPDAVQRGVVNTIFGGTSSSRITMNLRDDKHW